MKPEQIERLKELGSFLGSRDVRFVETALPTLLREREQLLGALRAARSALDRYGSHEEGFWRDGKKFYLCLYADSNEPTGTPCNCGLHAADQAAAAAITAAES